MNFFYFAVPPCLAVFKVVMQGKFSKNKVKTLSDVFLLNALIFSALTLVMSALFLRAIPPLPVILFSVLSAGLNVMFQVCYTLAFRCGPVSLTTVINNFNILFPLSVGFLFYQEAFGLLTILGLLLLMAAFLLIPQKSGGKVNGKWFALAILAFVGSGSNNALMLFFSRSGYTNFKESYIAVSYLFSALLCLFLFGMFRARETGGTLKPNAGICLGTLAIGTAVGFYNLTILTALESIPSVIFYPVINVATMLLITLCDVIFFRERLSGRSAMGLALGIAAVVLLNL